jgi:hypothetical protein
MHTSGNPCSYWVSANSHKEFLVIEEMKINADAVAPRCIATGVFIVINVRNHWCIAH